MATILFKLPIEAQGNAEPGYVEVSRPVDRVYLVTFVSGPDNRLTTNFIRVFLHALDIIQHRFQNGVVITTSGIQKFYSNGMDLEHVSQTPNFFQDSFYPLFRRLLTYPMPLVAWINGHAFAGGMIMAMHHDYRIQNPNKGFLCMNEVLFGAALQPPMTSIYREKLHPNVFRQLVLEGYRFPAKESLDAGLVDGVGGLDETLEFIKQKQLISKGDTGIYGMLKEDMYRDTIRYLTQHGENVKWREAVEMEKKVRADEAKERVEKWETDNGKARL